MRLRRLTILLLCLCGCASRATVPSSFSSLAPKNVIVIIGDGMGPQQIALAFAHERFSRHRQETVKKLTQFCDSSLVGLHIPFTEKHLVNDSACAATQLSSGCGCEPQQVGIDAHSLPCENAVEVAKKLGMRAGAISDTRLTHATPASFGVHEEHRSMEDSIAWKLSNSPLDVMLSGGLSYFLPRDAAAQGALPFAVGSVTSERRDSLNPLANALVRGYHVVRDKRELSRASLPVLGLFATKNMGDAFHEGRDREPTLAEMTQRALTLLENPNGFFLMVEAGQIDWAGHANDAGWLLAEMKRLATLVAVIERFRQEHPDTLVLMTGDHETGGFGFSYTGEPSDGVTSKSSEGSKLNFGASDIINTLDASSRSLSDISREFTALPAEQRTPEKLCEMVRDGTRLELSVESAKTLLSGPEWRSVFYPYPHYIASARLAALLTPQMNIAWSTGTHTSTPIPIFARGPGAERFRGVMNTREFGDRLLALMQARERT